MDFLVGRGFDLSRIVPELENACVEYAGGRARVSRVGALEVFTADSSGLNEASDDGSRDDLYLFGGQFSVGTEFYHPLLSCRGLKGRIAGLLDGALSSHALNAGVFAAGRVDERGLRLVTDPLSQYPIYFGSHGERYLVSNSVQLIVPALRDAGLPVRPSLMPCLEGMVLGGSFGQESHIREIARLPFGHGILAAAALSLTPMESESPDLSYEETIQEGRAALARHIEAAALAVHQPRLVIADITGGGDSRCVLSLLIESSLRPELTGRCVTRFPNPDANVAGALMARFGIPVGEMPVPIDAPQVTQGRSRQELSNAANAAFTGGARFGAGVRPPIAFPSVLHFTSNFGELGGASTTGDFVAALERGGYDADRAVDHIVERRRRAGAIDLLSDEGLDLVRRKAVEALRGLEAEGIPREHLQAELYLRSRCRDHFGIQSRLRNTGLVSPDPLASLWVVEARRKLPRAAYRTNKVILDLMLAGGREAQALALMPMAGKRWDAELLPPSHAETYRSVLPVTPETPALSPMTGSLLASKLVLSERTKEAMRDPAQKARLLEQYRQATSKAAGARNVRFGNEAAITSNQAVMRRLLEAVPESHDVWRLISRDASIDYAHRAPEDFKSTVDAGALSHAIAGIAWMSEMPGTEAPLEIRAYPEP